MISQKDNLRIQGQTTSTECTSADAHGWIDELLLANVLDDPSMWPLSPGKLAEQTAHNINVRHRDGTGYRGLLDHYRHNLIRRPTFGSFKLEKHMPDWRQLLVFFLTMEDLYGEYSP